MIEWDTIIIQPAEIIEAVKKEVLINLLLVNMKKNITQKGLEKCRFLIIYYNNQSQKEENKKKEEHWHLNIENIWNQNFHKSLKFPYCFHDKLSLFSFINLGNQCSFFISYFFFGFYVDQGSYRSMITVIDVVTFIVLIFRFAMIILAN